MDVWKIGSRREVCWDEALMDTCEGIQVQMHKPEYRGVAMVCDKPWEGNCCGYFVLMPDGEHFRLYYRGWHWDVNADGTDLGSNHSSRMCVAVSDDGKTFRRIDAGICDNWGTRHNNITVEMTNQTVGTTGYNTVYKVDNGLSAGRTYVDVTPYAGYTIKVYRNLYENGKHLETKLESTSVYRSRDQVIMVSPADAYKYGIPGYSAPAPKPEPTPEPTPTPAPAPTPTPPAEETTPPAETTTPAVNGKERL